MRILFICKRRYTGKDVLLDRFGRLFEIPAGLSRQGHSVRAIAFNYSFGPGEEFRALSDDLVSWTSIGLLPLGWLSYISRLVREVEIFEPDVIIASSDALHAVLGSLIAKKVGIPYVVDLYDNYESFGLTKTPLLMPAFRRACRGAAAVVVVSQTLRGFVRDEYKVAGQIAVIGNGVRRDHFRPRDKAEARSLLGLPQGVRLIGTAGSLTSGRGISDLFRAHELLAKTDRSMQLVIAGPRDGSLRRASANVIDLGIIRHEDVPLLMNAVDVFVVCNKDSSFGRYCFPLKLNEALACGVPVVAAAVGDVSSLLAASPTSLYAPGDVSGLANSVDRLLEAPELSASSRSSGWPEVCKLYSDLLDQVVS